jgi:Flp pilus assembly protein TadG
MIGNVMALRRFLADDSGSMPVVIAIAFAGLVSFASMAIDIGYAMATKTAMQTVAKAAALAGARELGRVYEGQTAVQQSTYQLTTSDRTRVTTAVRDVAGKNPVMGQALDVADGDIQVGRWDAQARSFAVSSDRPNAVSVTALKDDSSNGPVTFFLAHVMGISSVNLAVSDIAALGAIGSVPPGELDLPVGISKAWFDSGKGCGDQIKFHPTGTLEGCAGWHTFQDSPANASTLMDIL